MEFQEHFRRAGLQPSDRVLDVGCGIGRMAIALTDFLDGQYCGFDVNRKWIEWCQANISQRHPNFSFQRLDAANRRYNPGGSIDAREARFPYEDAWFDFVILTSVFTHLLPRDAERYLSETRRVLRTGGTVFATFFLLNSESLGLLEAGKNQSGLSFRYPVGDCLTTNRQSPESAVAFPEDWVREKYAALGIRLRDVQYGSWCGRERFTSLQDIVVGDLAQ